MSGTTTTTTTTTGPMLRFQILGPLEVYRDDISCAPTASMQRALLSLLLLHLNEPLPTTGIIDVLWARTPPRSAIALLQIYVAALRRLLKLQAGPHREDSLRDSVLQTKPPGYVLRLDPGQLDLTQFRMLAGRGRVLRAGGRCAMAADTFRRALSQWRGAALTDIGRTGAFDHYALRLEEERRAVLQERVGVDLCQGRSIEVIGELEELCALHPLSESLHQQLMLALQLTGRRADGLNVYTRIRRTMIDEVGIEPGPGLRATQTAILNGRVVSEPGLCDPGVFSGRMPYRCG